MNKRYALVFTALIATITVAGCIHNGASDTTSEPGNAQSGEATVQVTNSGFQPETVTVEKGTTVVWENTGDRAVWPASNLHPTHTQYPGGNYDQSGTYQSSQACSGQGEQKGDAFDACERISPGESYTFTFEETGTWQYHDHLRSSTTGTVQVVEPQ